MASSITVHSLLDRISEDHLECPVCFGPFKRPKMLDCLHSFCLKCLQDLLQQDPLSSVLRCPLCRQETVLDVADDLPDNLTLSALVEEVRMQKQLLGSQGSEIKCQACDDELLAISRCADCDRFLCVECQRAHGRLAIMKTHRVYTLAQLRSGEIEYTSKLREEVPKCGGHPDQNLSFYCETCERLVCTTCCILDHIKPLHSLLSLPEALDRCKQDVAKQVAIVENKKTKLSIAMEEIDKSRNTLDTEFENTNEKISNLADDEVARIRQEEQRLKQGVAKMYQDAVRRFQTAQAANSQQMAQAEDRLDDVHRILAQGSCHDILHLKKKVLHNLQGLIGRPPEKAPGGFCFTDTTNEAIVGKVLVLENGEPRMKLRSTADKDSPNRGRMDGQKKWEFKTQIKTFGSEQTNFRCAFDVAIFANNEVIVADNEHKQLVTFSFQSSPKSSTTPQVLQIRHLTNPSRISVNKNEQLAVLDGSTVKIFNRQYQLLQQFVPDTGPGKGRSPKCLAMDDSSRVAVGYVHKKDARISLHNPDGSLIRSVPAPMIGDHLTMSRQKLIYTSYWRKKLVSVDYIGVVLFSVEVTSEMPGYWGPTGVCCDDGGDIYVAMNGCSSGEIHRFDQEGKFVGRVIQGCDSPRGVSISPAGDTVVAECRSVQIYHRSQDTTKSCEDEPDLAKLGV